MRNHPKFIQTKDKKIFEIERYSNGKFWIAASPPLVYDIAKRTFFQIINGREEQTDIEPWDADAGTHKTWLRLGEKRQRTL